MLLVLISLFVFVAWRFACRAEWRTRWLDAMYGARCGLLHRVGISVLAAGRTSLARCEELMAVEYPDFEVVLLFDGATNPALLHQLIKRYHLIRVDYLPSGELHPAAVRGLYRSRRRLYRRLVVVDSVATGCRALDVMADVATRGFLLPLADHRSLSSRAVEHLALELAFRSHRPPVWLAEWPWSRPLVWQREELIARGGFVRPRGRGGAYLFRRLTTPRHPLLRIRHGVQLLWMVLLVVPLFAGDVRGWMWVVTLLWGGVVWLRVRQLGTKDSRY